MRLNLVIVDDAPFIREVLKAICGRTPDIVVVGEAANGEEAVKLALELKPDMMLMDIVMPIKSGIDATIEILKNLPATKIIACSTVDENSMVLRALDAGCADYLVKPFKADQVLEVIRKANQPLPKQPLNKETPP